MSTLGPGTSHTMQTAGVRWQLHFSSARGAAVRAVDIDTLRFRVGRRRDLDLPLPSLQVSGLHAEFIQVGLRLFVRDLNSTNGTFVNGHRIDHHDYALRPGDRLRMADVEIIVHRRYSSGTVADTAAVLDTALGKASDMLPPPA